MATCATGHISQDPDYCDVCGARIGGPSDPQAPPERRCPDCGTPGTDRFCEACGYDFEIGGGRPTPESAPAWTAVVTADRDHFDTVIAEGGPDAASLTFPPYAPERRIRLTGEHVRIGRRSSSQPSPPEIDLREPPEDLGVSHTHAVLLAKPDGTWTLVDPGSTNRTYLNGSSEPIPLNVEVPLSDGDRIHLGAWTTITIVRD